MNPYERENLDTLLRSAGFQVALRALVVEPVVTMREDLLVNQALSLDERLARQKTIAALKEGVQNLYAKTRVPIPDWLKRELMIE